MGIKASKKFRKLYRQKINSLAALDLKKEIFRLARKRDILGIIVIALSVLLAISIFFNFR
jgi:hypothetical protein